MCITAGNVSELKEAQAAVDELSQNRSFGENPQKQTWNSTLIRELSLHLEKGERKARRRA